MGGMWDVSTSFILIFLISERFSSSSPSKMIDRVGSIQPIVGDSWVRFPNLSWPAGRGMGVKKYSR